MNKKDEEIIIPLEDLPEGFINSITEQIHNQNIKDIKEQGVAIYEFTMKTEKESEVLDEH